ncbi:MAG: SpoIVB peptidase [Oscillospiraceae bacterium]|nr:SpoIVB peptidase [Oscillospiraceae bacterium]
MQKTKNSIKIFAAVIICFSFIITASAANELIPLGHTTGIVLSSDGAMVVGFSDTTLPSPCKAAGIKVGDVIKSIGGVPVHSNGDLRKAVLASSGKELTVEYLRDGKLCSAQITPQKGENGEYVIGVMIRDGLAGIGTMTYYDPETKTYGALGHGVSDGETNVLIPIEDGSLLNSTVADVKKGKPGSPGELIGEYEPKNSFADIKKNTDCGIFGKISNEAKLGEGMKYPVAAKEEIKRGAATILSNIEGDEVREYSVEITSIYFDGEKTKNMLVRVTDPELLAKTGGIVRGMSGSPILQNGKLVGAVTHVLVNDPKKGYAIFIENMLDAAA